MRVTVVTVVVIVLVPMLVQLDGERLPYEPEVPMRVRVRMAMDVVSMPVRHINTGAAHVRRTVAMRAEAVSYELAGSRSYCQAAPVQLSPGLQSVLRFVVRARLLPHAPPGAAARAVFEYVWLRLRLRRGRVRGWCDLCDGFVLFWLASFVPRQGPIVEIGVSWGLSTIVLATAGGEVIAVDPYEGDFAPRLEVLGSNLERLGVRDRVDCRRLTSHEAAEAYDGPPIGLLYVDGDHSYEAVAADIRDWLPHLRPGGVMAFHDYGPGDFPGVERAVREAVARGALERPTHFSFVATARRLPLAAD